MLDIKDHYCTCHPRIHSELKWRCCYNSYMDIHSYFCPSSSSLLQQSVVTMRMIQVMRAYVLALQRDNVPDHGLPWKYNRKWEQDFTWLEYWKLSKCKVHIVKCAESQRESQSQASQGSSGVCVTKPFQNWKKVIQNMKAHAGGETHIRYVEAELLAKNGKSIAHHL